MDWRSIWTASFNHPPPVYHLHPIIGSLLFYATTFFIASSLRRLNKAVSPRPVREYVADFISTFQTCACSFENGNALRLYGWLGLYMVVFTLMMLYSRTFTDSVPNPLGNAKKYFQHRQPLLKTLAKLSLQAFSGYCAWQYVRQFWSLDFHEYHAIRGGQSQCYTALSVSVVLGIVIEAGASLIDILLSSHRLVPWKSLTSALTCSLLTALIVSGLGLTGMYFHPAMASAQTFGCKGTNHWEHVLVYWIGPFCGCFVGVKINNIIKKATAIPGSRLKQKAQKADTNNSKLLNGNTRLNNNVKSDGKTAARKRQVNNNNNNNIHKAKSRNTNVKRSE